MRRYLAALGLLAVIVGAVAALGRFRADKSAVPEPSRATNTGFPRTLVGKDGKRLTIPKKPERIVSLTLATDEILLEICPPSRIAALHAISLDPKYSNCVEESRRIPVHVTAEVEHVLKLNPDLIFIASYSRAEVVELLSASGAPVHKFEAFDSIEGVMRNIREVGYAVGEERAAEQLIQKMITELALVAANLPLEKPRVVSYGQMGDIAAKGTMFDDCVRRAGAINVAAEKGLEGFQRINSETLVEWDPDFIVIGAEAGKFDEARKKLLSDPVIASTRAAKAGHIVPVDDRYFLAVSQHVVKAVRALAEGLHSSKTANGVMQ